MRRKGEVFIEAKVIKVCQTKVREKNSKVQNSIYINREVNL